MSVAVQTFISCLQVQLVPSYGSYRAFIYKDKVWLHIGEDSTSLWTLMRSVITHINVFYRKDAQPYITMDDIDWIIEPQ